MIFKGAEFFSPKTVGSRVSISRQRNLTNLPTENNKKLD